MNISGTNKMAGRHSINTGTMIWSGARRTCRQPEVSQRCYYCSGSLECGQQECIWLQACA